MIRINFCKTGASVSDWDIDSRVEFLKSMAVNHWSDLVYDYSNLLLFDALRAEIAEGKISLDNITFSVDDKPLEVNRYGACHNYPKEAESACNYSTRVLIAAMNLRKKEEEDRCMAKYGVKTFKEVAELKKKGKLRSCGGPESLEAVYRDEKEESSTNSKINEEGQAPGSDRDSTTSGNS